MYDHIGALVSNCDSCARQRAQHHTEDTYPNLVTELGDWVQMDFVGPLPRTKRKNKYILVAVEVVTRWCEAVPCKAATGAEVVKFLEEVLFPRFGAVRNIQTDQGSHFRNHEVAAVMAKYKVTHHFSTAYHPQSNGIVERQNQTLARMLAR